MHDLTEQVTTIAAESGIRYWPHPRLHHRQHSEPGLERDLPELLDKLIPPLRHYATNKPGMTGTATHIFKPRCSAVAYRPARRRQTRLWYLAADLAPGMRRPRKAKDGGGDHQWGLVVIDAFTKRKLFSTSLEPELTNLQEIWLDAELSDCRSSPHSELWWIAAC